MNMNSLEPQITLGPAMYDFLEEFQPLGYATEKTETGTSMFDKPVLKRADLPTKLQFLEKTYWMSLFSLIEVDGTLSYNNLPPIFKAIERNDVNCFKTYFSNPNADTETRIVKDGATVLTFACFTNSQTDYAFPDRHLLAQWRRRRLHIIQFLIGKGANVNSRCSGKGSPWFTNLTPLYLAVKEKNQPLVRLLLENQASPSIELKPHNTTALHIAAFNGPAEICQMLLKSGADINCRDVDGNTPLIFACATGRSTVTNELLTWSGSRKADVNLRNNTRNISALHAAVYGGSSKVVQFLLRRGADINAETVEGHTPLDMATFLNRYEIRRILNKERALASTFDKSKAQKPIQSYLVPSYGSPNPLEAVIAGNFLDDLEYLIKHGAKVNALDAFGQTPLFIAAFSGSVQGVNFLLNSNADINVVSIVGQTALHLALSMGHEQIVSILLEHCAKVDNFPQPLMFTAAQLPLPHEWDYEGLMTKRARIIELLIAKGAPLDEKYDDECPLEHAIKWKNEPVAMVINRQNHIFRCIQNNNLTELRKCIKTGALPNCRSVKFGTPLQYAVIKNQLNTVSCLIENGADVNFAPSGHVTPLHYAAKFNFHAIAHRLLTSGAIFDATTVKSGKTPLEICLESNPEDCETAKLLKFVEGLFGLEAEGVLFTTEGTRSLIIKARNSRGHSVDCTWRVARQGAEIST